MRFKDVISMIVEYLTLKFIHVKYFYPFMFAHKPLCNKYKNDSICFNNIYICRSCLFLYLGVILAFLLYKYINFNPMMVLIGLLLIILLSSPVYYKFYSRITRDFSRFFLGFLSILFLIRVYSINRYYFVCSVLCLLFIKHLYNVQRGKVDLCKNCCELSDNSICSGYKKQSNAILLMEEEMSNYVMYKRWRIKND